MKKFQLIFIGIYIAIFSLDATMPIGEGNDHFTYNQKYFSCDYEYYQRRYNDSGPLYGFEYQEVAYKTFQPNIHHTTI